MTDCAGKPEPLTPEEIDLRNYSFFPLEFERLFSSETWVLGNPEERVACLYLWCKSWHQIPAGSLPNDDRMLAELSRSGVRWRKIRAHALRGWVLCNDGRLYHPIVVEKAVEAWSTKRTASVKGKAGAEKRWGKGNAPATADLWQGDSNRSEMKGNEGITAAVVAFTLPAWVPSETWAAFEEMRKAAKKPMTDRARGMIIAELSRLGGPSGKDVQAVLEQSIRNNWQDVYPLRDRRPGAAGAAGLQDKNAAVAASFAAGGTKP